MYGRLVPQTAKGRHGLPVTASGGHCGGLEPSKAAGSDPAGHALRTRATYPCAAPGCKPRARGSSDSKPLPRTGCWIHQLITLFRRPSAQPCDRTNASAHRTSCATSRRGRNTSRVPRPSRATAASGSSRSRARDHRRRAVPHAVRVDPDARARAGRTEQRRAASHGLTAVRQKLAFASS